MRKFICLDSFFSVEGDNESVEKLIKMFSKSRWNGKQILYISICFRVNYATPEIQERIRLSKLHSEETKPVEMVVNYTHHYKMNKDETFCIKKGKDKLIIKKKKSNNIKPIEVKDSK